MFWTAKDLAVKVESIELLVILSCPSRHRRVDGCISLQCPLQRTEEAKNDDSRASESRSIVQAEEERGL